MHVGVALVGQTLFMWSRFLLCLPSELSQKKLWLLLGEEEVTTTEGEEGTELEPPSTTLFCVIMSTGMERISEI